MCSDVIWKKNMRVCTKSFRRRKSSHTRIRTDAEAFFREMQDADGLLTAFIPLDKQALDRMPRLKAISINATGYNFVDLEETCRRDIPVCAIGEYCTQEVAEHTMAMLLALDRNLRVYARTVDKERRWQYYAAPTPMGLHGSTLGRYQQPYEPDTGEYALFQ